tara:strand:- start:75 stop:593 length:519 start_codon:yes stop_codon:yes gene_type:complete
MTRIIKITLTMIIFFIIGCEDEAGNNNEMVVHEITTSNVSKGPFHFNLINVEPDSSTWHLLYQNIDVPFGGSTYKMPSFSLHNSVMLTVDNSSKFEEIDQSPSPSSFTSEEGRMQYGGKNAALLYDMANHKVMTSKETYIVYCTVTHKVFKIYFDEYSGGVVLFRYAELPGN